MCWLLLSGPVLYSIAGTKFTLYLEHNISAILDVYGQWVELVVRNDNYSLIIHGSARVGFNDGIIDSFLIEQLGMKSILIGNGSIIHDILDTLSQHCQQGYTDSTKDDSLHVDII